MKLDRSTIEAWLLDRIEGRLTPDQERELSAFLLVHPDLADELGPLPEVEKERLTFTGKDELKRTLPPTGEVDAGNLDEYLVAHMEGVLTQAQKAGLELYLHAHPEAAKSARQMEATRVLRDHIPFGVKVSIVRTFPPQGMPDRHRLDDFLVAKLHGELDAGQERAMNALIASDAAVARAWSIMQRTQVLAGTVVFDGKQALKKREVKVIPLWSRAAMRYAAAASVALLLGFWWFTRGTNPDEQLAEDPVVKTPTGQAATPGSTVIENAPIADTSTASVVEPEGSKQAPNVAPDEEAPENTNNAPEAPSPYPERHAPVRIDRMHPLLASSGSVAKHGAPIDAAIPDVPVSCDAPTGIASSTPPPALSIGELLANTFRGEVLDQPQRVARAIDGSDALALADKGLHAIGGEKSGVSMQREGGRRRFSLRLGDGLAIATSTGR